jgi:methionyl-tRNA formyltransferase
VVVGYGQIIPQSVIDLAPVGIINVHASLLPKYRGAAPIQWAIANGETRTGVTTMRIDAGLDTGDMLLKAQTEIGPEENAIELGQRLAVMGADLLVETMAGLAAGTIVAEKQDASQATLAPILKKEDGLIDWTLDAEKIRNGMRGLQPWPGTYTTFRGRTLHVWKAVEQAILPAMPAVMPAHFVSLKPLVVKCGEGALELLEVQLEGRKRISAADFANGHRLTENDILGIAK